MRDGIIITLLITVLSLGLTQFIRIEHRLTKLETLVRHLINLNGGDKHACERRKDK